jgi:hypothetical protein
VYVVEPAISGVTHVWQTPLRHEKRVGTSQASANSRMLAYLEDQFAVIPLRENDTVGPVPAGPAGGCGRAVDFSTIPGLIGGRAPNNSL